MLTADQLQFRYAPNRPWILHDVSLEIAPGEVVGLRGDSGLGKTTLAKILAGYLTPTTGRVQVDGASIPERGCCPVQLVFQHPELAVDPRWKIRDILTEGHDPPSEMLDALSIDRGWLDRWPHELSGGELQRIAVARALNPATRYLIADEITSMLDANTQAQLWQVLLAHARQRGMGILAISHHQALLERLCHRVMWLQQRGTSDAAGGAEG